MAGTPNRPSPPLDEQIAILRKGVVDLLIEPDLRRKLERARAGGRPLRVKVGFDPSAPDIHLGHTVLMRKMKQFQDLGHEVIFVIGDFTGLIGDPTGRSRTRPQLTREEIDRNAESYKAQAFKILDPARTVVWGDGTDGSSLFAAPEGNVQALVYARIPAGQDVAAGAYTDTLVVTIFL